MMLLSYAGCWLLAAGCWLLAAGCWLLAAGCWQYYVHNSFPYPIQLIVLPWGGAQQQLFRRIVFVAVMV